ncbi:hypothetical protein GQ43DRAFT_461720 [Delitschia confertaspora ATCC 74209]|uniref:Uncharacterized protein n=1 Tax=Delitschia confertaspora ATCC 74209 TaxID=1513339 RepID=A0A9P4JQF8_9PLEO|nr:hypothetical protein GQ43DRAFT_461720 [Delitschia confertaspora ATCC 74209]
MKLTGFIGNIRERIAAACEARHIKEEDVPLPAQNKPNSKSRSIWMDIFRPESPKDSVLSPPSPILTISRNSLPGGANIHRDDLFNTYIKLTYTRNFDAYAQEAYAYSIIERYVFNATTHHTIPRKPVPVVHNEALPAKGVETFLRDGIYLITTPSEPSRLDYWEKLCYAAAYGMKPSRNMTPKATPLLEKCTLLLEVFRIQHEEFLAGGYATQIRAQFEKLVKEAYKKGGLEEQFAEEILNQFPGLQYRLPPPLTEANLAKTANTHGPRYTEKEWEELTEYSDTYSAKLADQYQKCKDVGKASLQPVRERARRRWAAKEAARAADAKAYERRFEEEYKTLERGSHETIVWPLRARDDMLVKKEQLAAEKHTELEAARVEERVAMRVLQARMDKIAEARSAERAQNCKLKYRFRKMIGRG